MPADRPRIDELPELATVEMVAKALYCSANFVRQRCADGDIRATRIAGRYLVEGPAAVREYVERCRCPSRTEVPGSNGAKSAVSGKSSGTNLANDAAVRRAQQIADKLKKSSGRSSGNKSRSAPVIPLNGG